MNKLIFSTVLWLAAVCPSWAQQLPLLSQFQESVGVLNPAAVANSYFKFEHDVRFGAAHHAQWTGLEGNPQTSQLVGEVLFDDYSPVSPLLGAYFINDQTGPTGLTGLYLKAGGVISDDPYYRGLSIGLSVGVTQYRLNLSELELRDEEAVLAAEDDGTVSPDAGVGVFAYQRFGDHVGFVGFSSPQVLGLDLSYRGNDGEIATRRYRHYYAQAGAVLDLGDDSYLEPVAWVKFVPEVPVNVSTTVRYQTPSAFFVGLGGSSARMVHGEAGVLLGDRSGAGALFRIGYGFDYSFVTFGSFAGPTHELSLNYSFER